MLSVIACWFGGGGAWASIAINAEAERSQVSLRIPGARKAPPLPRVYGDDDSRPLVVIDAGHGGHDPGALSPETGLREKELTLKTALAIKDRLLKSGRVRVALTRESDKFLILQERYGIARRLGANLFISVHCDSAGNPLATGATAYTLSDVASDKEAARLAARENRADVLAGIDLGDTTTDISSLLIDLAQRETMNRSAHFARLLGREAQPLIPVRPVFHRMASLMVLKAPDMPSVLFETGYLSNKGDADLINSREGREKIAESVKRATEIFFARRLTVRRPEYFGRAMLPPQFVKGSTRRGGRRRGALSDLIHLLVIREGHGGYDAPFTPARQPVPLLRPAAGGDRADGPYAQSLAVVPPQRQERLLERGINRGPKESADAPEQVHVNIRRRHLPPSRYRECIAFDLGNGRLMRRT